jgi:hypothetical protein
VGDADSALTLAGQARARPYLLEGERVAIRGTERGGAAAVHIDGNRVVEALRSDAGMGVNVVVSPSLLRRECVGDRGTVLETVLALPTLPMAAFEWNRGDDLAVSFSVLPGQDEVRYNARGRTLRAEPSDPDLGVEVLIHPEPESWQIVEGVGGGILVHVRVHARGPVTLLVTSGAPEVTARSLEAGRHLEAHALRSATDQDPSNVAGLLPRTGVAEVDQGVGWATVRQAGELHRREPPAPGDWFWAGVGALASGDATGALLAAERVGDERGVSVWGGAAAPGPALSTFLTARATLLSRDEAPARHAMDSLSASALAETRRGCDPASWAWWTLALTTLADALRYAAPEAEVQALREAAAGPAGRTPRALPMVGEGPEPGSAPWLGALLRGEGLARGGDARGGTAGAPSLSAWRALASGDVEGGYAAWRSLLGEGLGGTEGPRGSWTPPGRGASSVIATLAFGLLGLEPDAPSGRIRIAPAVPAHLRDFRVRGIRVGDARLELAYTREGSVHRFRLSVLDGRVPPMVVLEPSLPLAALGAVRVDGAPAGLNHESHGPDGSRTRLRLQIPVDGPRLLEIEGA